MSIFLCLRGFRVYGVSMSTGVPGGFGRCPGGGRRYRIVVFQGDESERFGVRCMVPASGRNPVCRGQGAGKVTMGQGPIPPGQADDRAIALRSGGGTGFAVTGGA